MRLTAYTCVFLLSGCAFFGGGFNNAAGTTAKTIEYVAESTRIACGNTQPGGPCSANGLIDTATKERIKVNLQRAQNTLQHAVELNMENRDALAEDRLAQADAILSAIEAILNERGIE